MKQKPVPEKGDYSDPERFKEQLAKLVEHKPVEIRDAGGLEAEADAMGARALKHKPVPEKPE